MIQIKEKLNRFDSIESKTSYKWFLSSKPVGEKVVLARTKKTDILKKSKMLIPADVGSDRLWLIYRLILQIRVEKNLGKNPE